MGDSISYFCHLIDLFLITTENDVYFEVLENTLYFIREAGLIDSG